MNSSLTKQSNLPELPMSIIATVPTNHLSILIPNQKNKIPSITATISKKNL